MNTTTAASALLAAALLAVPPPRRRLSAVRSRRAAMRVAMWAAAILAAAITFSALPGLSVTALLMVVVIQRRHRRRTRDHRRRVEGHAMAAALEVVAGELRVGAHPLHAFGIAANESVGGVGVALRGVAIRAQLGADVAAGLRSAAMGSSVPAYWNRLAVYWQLAAQYGLAMSTLMRTANHDIVARQRFADRVHAGLAGARATATILAGLPFLGVALGELIGARPIRFLLGGGAGSWLLALGVGLVGIGIMWSDRINDRLKV